VSDSSSIPGPRSPAGGQTGAPTLGGTGERLSEALRGQFREYVGKYGRTLVAKCAP
jgi:hypothetical protein